MEGLHIDGWQNQHDTDRRVVPNTSQAAAAFSEPERVRVRSAVVHWVVHACGYSYTASDANASDAHASARALGSLGLSIALVY